MQTVSEFLEEFREHLAEEGDVFFSTGNDEDDYNIVVSTIKANGGYWAGNAVRYVYDKNLNFEGVQQRMFGSS